MNQVKDIMTTDVITVSTGDSVELCAKLMQEHNISGLPVLSEAGRVAGIVTEGDLIRRASRIKAPGYLEILGGLIYLGSPKKFVEELQRAMSLEAGQLMSKDVIFVDPEDGVEKAATLMVEKNISRLPVIDDGGKLVGILSRRDIMKCLYNSKD
ncbi:MAG: CBS domain-containing protein [Bacillota bacterium]|nr:CBS domain-containing protein [Bacillota bacterium]MDW7730519.1 CBS domain-containing protein [Bacillota bacterium]